MGLSIAFVAALSPRLAIILLWVFTNYVTVVFSTWIWPLLGDRFAVDDVDVHPHSGASRRDHILGLANGGAGIGHGHQ